MTASTIFTASKGVLVGPRATVARLTVCALVCITVAEILVATGSVVPGLVVDALLLILLVNAYALGDSEESHEPRDVLLALSLVPLLRLASVTLALPDVSPVTRIAFIGAPLLLAVVLQARIIGLEILDVVIRPSDVVIGLVGLPVGYVGYLILRPAPLLASPSTGEFLVACLVLLIFTGFVEEAMFRWLILRTLDETFVRGGVFISSALFAVMYLGTGSPGFVIFAGLAGLAACAVVRRTESLLGVALAHGLASIGILLVWPLVL
jgi:CAAX protease family protein